MAGPWEKYQAREPVTIDNDSGKVVEGPWTRYGGAGAQPAAPRPSAPPAAAAPAGEPAVKPPPPLSAGNDSTYGFVTGNLNKGIAGLAGLPVDTARNLLNLGIAGYGYLRGNEMDRARYGFREPPELIEPGPGSGAWFEGLMRRGGMVTPSSDPTSTGGRYAAAALQAIPSAALGRVAPQQAPRAVGGQAVSGMTGELAADIGGEEWRGVGAMAPGARRIASPPSAGDRARTERQAQRFETARDMGIPIPPREMRPNKPRDRMEDATNKEFGFPQGTEITPQHLRSYTKQMYADGYEPLIKAPELAGGVRPNAAFQAELQRIGSEISAGRQNLPTTFKSSREAMKLLGEYGFGALPGNVKMTVPPRQQPIPAAVAVRAIKKLRDDASTNFASDKPEQKTLAVVQKDLSNALEKLIEDNLSTSGNQMLLDNFRKSRTMIAKANDVIAEIDPRTGKLSAAKAASVQADRPLSGGLKDISDVVREFPGAMQGPKNQELFTQRVTPMAVLHPQAMAAHWSARLSDPLTTSAPYQRFVVDPRSQLTPEQLQMLRFLSAANAANRREIPVPPR